MLLVLPKTTIYIRGIFYIKIKLNRDRMNDEN